MEHNQNNNELKHYGVLGMKWGIRRRRHQDAKAQYKSRMAKATTDAERKAAKEQYKADKNDKSKDVAIANKLYSHQSKGANKRVAKMKMGKAMAQSFLLGSYGALKYNEAKARGSSRGAAAVEGILFNTANSFAYGALSAYKYIDNRMARTNPDD